MTGIRSRRRQQQQEKAEGEVDDLMMNRAEAPLNRMENTVVAFNYLWIQFLKFFASAMIAASLYFSYKEYVKDHFSHVPIIVFHLTSPLAYILSIRWLDSVDVTFTEALKEPLVNMYSTPPFLLFFTYVMFQCAYAPVLMVLEYNVMVWYSCIPTSLPFLIMSALSVAFQRYNLRSHKTQGNVLREQLYRS